jgi:hypothetical protein
MAVAYDTSVVGGGAGVNSIALPAISTAGANEKLLCFSHESQNADNISSITGGSGITWTFVAKEQPNHDTNTGWVEIWEAYATAQLSSVVFTVNYTASNFPHASAIIAAFSGAKNAVVGTSNTAIGNSGSPSVNLTTTATNSLVVGCWGSASANTGTAGSNQTIVEENGGSFSIVDFSRQNAVTSSSGSSVTINGTMTSTEWAAVCCEVLDPGVVAGPQTLNNYQFVKVGNGMSTSEKIK